MLLTIDVGNTNSVLCVFDGEDVVDHWRIATDPVRTADELAVTLRGLLSQSERVEDAGLDGIAMCSTVPSVLHEMREMLGRYYERRPRADRGAGRQDRRLDPDGQPEGSRH